MEPIAFVVVSLAILLQGSQDYKLVEKKEKAKTELVAKAKI